MDPIELDHFQEVWSRVSGGQPEIPQAMPAPDESARLRMFLQDEADDAAAYTQLAGMVSSPELRGTFSRLSREEQCHRRRLQSAYFLLTGDTCPVRAGPPKRGTVLSLLRLRLLGEREGERAYRAAARDTRDAELGQLYAELAEEERRHGSLLHRLVDCLLR